MINIRILVPRAKLENDNSKVSVLAITRTNLAGYHSNPT